MLRKLQDCAARTPPRAVWVVWPGFIESTAHKMADSVHVAERLGYIMAGSLAIRMHTLSTNHSVERFKNLGGEVDWRSI